MATRPSPKASTARKAGKPASAAKAAARPLEETITEGVVARLKKTPDPRLRAVMIAFVRHLHAFIREIEPTEAEWMEGIKFLTAIGQKCDDMRQEFILFSDTHGATMLIDAINHRVSKGATE